MPIRMPFSRRPGSSQANDENSAVERQDAPGFERVNTVGSKASSALSVRTAKSEDTGEYKMSVVNDSGIYLPPSPTEDKGPWARKYLTARSSTENGSEVGDIEHFSISRESFDSYRRSFDITARSPVPTFDFVARQSLDSARFPRLPRGAMDRKLDIEPTTTEDFEEVGLDDHKQQPRKRGFFSKFGDGQDKESTGQQAPSRFRTGRKRGQSGQGAELGSMQQKYVTAENAH